MKKTLLLILLFCTATVDSTIQAAAQSRTISGRVLDEAGEAVEYANAVLLDTAERQVAGTTTDSRGAFALDAAAGDYSLRVFSLGYEERVLAVRVEGDVAMGDIVLAASSTEIKAVRVTERMVVREADRFVVNVEGNPVAMGKDAFEMLKASPGVWAQGGSISVNGKSGTRVMINDRLLRMSGEDLETYLKTINAEDIGKIEVILDSGAEYDADTSGGIIKITLSKPRTDGLVGNAQVSGGTSRYGNVGLGPSFGLNYQKNKWQLSANLGYNYGRTNMTSPEHAVYNDAGRQVGFLYDNDRSESALTGSNDSYSARFGAFYDIAERHNIGLELNGTFAGAHKVTDASTWRHPFGGSLGGQSVDSVTTVGAYDEKNATDFIGATLNYLYRMDDEGSTFKVIADYNRNIGDNRNRYEETSRGWLAGVGSPEVHGLTDQRSESDYTVSSLDANFNIVTGAGHTIRTGAKYGYNSMDSRINTGIDPSTQKTDYAENIGALYFIYNATLGKFGLSAGLRGEYTTMTTPEFTDSENPTESTRINRHYADLFPNANVSYSLDAMRGHTLVASYSRGISRPGFWALNPYRTMISPTTFVSGNPDLKPTYSNDISLTGVLKHRYSITLGAQLMQNMVAQIVRKEDASDDLLYIHENLPNAWNYYLAFNAPFQIAPWWTVNANIVGLSMKQRLPETLAERSIFLANGYVMMSFVLPREYTIEASAWGMTRAISGNMTVEPMGNVSLAFKRRFADGKFTASLDVDNIFDLRQRVHSSDRYFDRWMDVSYGNYLTVSLSLRYNFKSGVSFRTRQVERNAESSRISGGGSGVGGGQ